VQTRYQLQHNGERLELHDSTDPKIGPVYVDFVSGKARHRLQFGGGKGQAIAKAVGLHKIKQPRIVDATAGLGREAFVLASLGCEVTLLERSPILHALLADGLQRALHCEDVDLRNIASRMQLHHADAQVWLHSLSAAAYPDVVYLDPMFPERRKSAQIQKEMRFLHAIVGEDPDANDLLSIARQRCHKRVTVKRPRLAPALADYAPAFVIQGKVVRYDVYLALKT